MLKDLIQKMYNLVEYSYYTGWPNEVIRYISITVGIFRLRYQRVKIGITNNPERRFCEHQRRDGWERMIVKYETSSIKNANEIEKYFINRHDWLENSWVGWSNMGAGLKYYVYILLANRIETPFRFNR